jgi:hypothetical protein
MYMCVEFSSGTKRNGVRSSIVVEALCYKPGLRLKVIDFFFNLPNPSSRTQCPGV